MSMKLLRGGSQSVVDRLELMVGLLRKPGLTGEVELRLDLGEEAIEMGDSGTGEEGRDMAAGSTISSCSKKAA